MSADFTPEKIVGLVARSFPNADQVYWIDIGQSVLRLKWREVQLQITVNSLFVEEHQGQMLVGSNIAALVEMLLKKQWRLEAELEGGAA